MRPIFYLSTVLLILTSCAKESIEIKVESFSDEVFNLLDEDLYAGYGLVELNDGYAVISGENDVNLLKVDKDFEKSWIKTYSPKQAQERLTIEKSGNNGFLIAGSKKDNNGDTYSAHIIKTNLAGKADWMRNYGVYSDARANAITVAGDDSYIFVGSDQYSGSNGSNYSVNWIDNEGNTKLSLDEDKTVVDQAWAIERSSDQNFGVLFTTSNNRSQHKLGLTKLDAEFNILWTSNFEEFNTKTPGYGMITTKDNGFLIGSSVSMGGQGNTNVQLLKVDGNGNEVWNRNYGGAFSEELSAVTLTSDGGYVIVGSTDSFGQGGKDVLLMKTGKSGKIKWSKTFGSEEDDIGFGVIENSDGNLIISGMSNEKMFLLSTDKKGMPL